MIFESMCGASESVNGTCYCVNGTSQCNQTAETVDGGKPVKLELKL